MPHLPKQRRRTPGDAALAFQPSLATFEPCDKMKQVEQRVLGASLDKLYFVMLSLISFHQQVTRVCVRVCVCVCVFRLD